ncbi:metal-dependent phosphohydrolase [Clostridium sp. CAG:567]|jgi:8-oxo-dGTP pyrophosphatase MutT (NUDIX family)|nr:metal-dependent phosphohydrolase [Clostridium sp. CAG:567]
MEEIEYLDFVDENNNVIEKEDLCMNDFDYLLEKAKEEKIEKNVVGSVIVNRQGKILIMSRKSDDFMGGIDELPSGNMEIGEDIPTALAREVKEETNCELNEILYYIDSFDYKSGSGKNARQYNFAIKVKETDNIVLTEHESYSWQTVEEIINNPKITHEVKNTIKRYNDIKLEYEAMIEKYKIKLELIKYIEQIVNYHYNLNDKGHGVEHAKYVINRSFEFAYQVESINLEMVYVIAAYHDVAHHIDAKNHETISAKMLMEDKKLKDFFTDEQIKIMSEAVEDHRSSMETEPRSIYGKIVSSADRNTSVEVTLKRCYSYNRRHFSELKESEIIEECRKFLLKKFGINGYARSKMFFDDKEYKKYLDDITDLALDSDKFAVEIKKVNEIY